MQKSFLINHIGPLKLTVVELVYSTFIYVNICRCSKDRKAQHEWGIYAKCRGPEPRVELLPLQNVTWLNLFSE